MFVKINLPRPSKQLVKEIHRIVQSSPLELDLKRTHDAIQNHTVNSVSRKFIEDDKIFNDLVQQEFSSHFTEPFYPAVGIVTNIDQTRIACWPPHSDRVRIFALNYYLKEGGTNVETVVYNLFDNYTAGTGTGKIYNYCDLEKDKIYHLAMNQWYGLNVRQVHSIENVVTKRIIFTISFHDFTFIDFQKKYSELIIEEESHT